jgi:hypothetical protein
LAAICTRWISRTTWRAQVVVGGLLQGLQAGRAQLRIGTGEFHGAAQPQRFAPGDHEHGMVLQHDWTLRHLRRS